MADDKNFSNSAEFPQNINVNKIRFTSCNSDRNILSLQLNEVIEHWKQAVFTQASEVSTFLVLNPVFNLCLSDFCS